MLRSPRHDTISCEQLYPNSVAPSYRVETKVSNSLLCSCQMHISNCVPAKQYYICIAHLLKTAEIIRNSNVFYYRVLLCCICGSLNNSSFLLLSGVAFISYSGLNILALLHDSLSE